MMQYDVGQIYNAPIYKHIYPLSLVSQTSKELSMPAAIAKAQIDPREKDLKVPDQQLAATCQEKGGKVSVGKVGVVKDLKRGEALVHLIYSGVSQGSHLRTSP
jgi:hypothetical protein